MGQNANPKPPSKGHDKLGPKPEPKPKVPKAGSSPEAPLAVKAPRVATKAKGEEALASLKPAVIMAVSGAEAPKRKGRVTPAHKIMTERIIDLLSKDIVPWQRPWKVDAFPRNIGGRPYRGINPFFLAITAEVMRYNSPVWLTMTKITALGGKLIPIPADQRKIGDKSATGQHPTPVVFWKMIDVEKADKDEDEGSSKPKKAAEETEGEPKKLARQVPILKFYQVFNLDQVEGIDKTRWEGKNANVVLPPNEALENLLAGYEAPPKISFGVDALRGQRQAWYSPSKDEVHMPPRKSFADEAGYMATLCHELAHSTGHESRLARPGVTELAMFGSHSYAEEELVAEMTACFLMGHVGIDHEPERQMEQHAAYIKTWMENLQGDPTLIVRVAGLAQRAYDHILGTKFGEAETTEPVAVAV